MTKRILAELRASNPAIEADNIHSDLKGILKGVYHTDPISSGSVYHEADRAGYFQADYLPQGGSVSLRTSYNLNGSIEVSLCSEGDQCFEESSFSTGHFPLYLEKSKPDGVLVVSQEKNNLYIIFRKI